MKKLNCCILAALFLGGCLFFGSAVPAFSDTITLRMAEPSPKRGTEVVWVDWFTKELEKRTFGRVKVKVYWGGALAKLKEGAEACKTGVSDLGWVTNAYHPGFGSLAKVPYAAGFFSPNPSPVFLTDKWLKMNDNIPALYEEYEKTNMIPFIMRWYDVYWSFSNKPVRSLSDYKGMKVRAVTQLQQIGFKAIGAVPVFLPFGEVYGALQKGIVDAVASSPDTAARYKIHEVTKYVIRHDIMGAWAQWCINLNTFKKLNWLDQKTLLQLGREVSMMIADINEKQRQKLIGVFEKAGLEIIPFPEKDKEVWAAKPQLLQYTEKFIKEEEEKGYPAREMVDYYLKLVNQ
ncbi:MAG: TRAP transporter substrate-binding protein DctP [Deltaproteobacteria bacterium]|nr:TRAP transporter substrate-binding protein DctP [Deltaproteobacteria bacterium]